MLALKPGDRVNCKIKDNKIVNAYDDFDNIKTFEVIAVSENGYILFVPQYVFIGDSIIVNAYRCNIMNINLRFLNEQMVYIHEKNVFELSEKLDGFICDVCQEFVSMASVNQEGGTFVCWSCRQHPYRWKT